MKEIKQLNVSDSVCEGFDTGIVSLEEAVSPRKQLESSKFATLHILK